MPKPSLHHHPSLDTSNSVAETLRPSLFDTKDEFIGRIAPFATAAIYFGGFSLLPSDSSLSRQALFKLSFLHRHFLQPAGLQVSVDKHTVVLSGSRISSVLVILAEILAQQIEGVRQVKDETKGAPRTDAMEIARESTHFLFATDQTLRSGVEVLSKGGRLVLAGDVVSATEKNWAEQLAATIGVEVESSLKVGSFVPPPHLAASQPPQVDDESLQALVLFRLRLVRETEHLPVKVKASRGILTLQGKVRSEALRQRVENIARSALGVRELRSSLALGE